MYSNEAIKLSQLYSIIFDEKYQNRAHVIAENFLQRNELNINAIVASDDSFQLDPQYSGCTVLHLAFDQYKLEVFKVLIKYGSDYTIMNNEGKTVVHQAIEDSYNKKEACWKLKGTFEHPFIDAVLAAHIESQNPCNPSNKDGLSHFDAAVMTDNVRAVELFLKHGVSATEPFSSDSQIFPSYTPLHLAARYCSVESTKLLLDYGAAVHTKDAQGMTPLHLLIQWKIEIADWDKTQNKEPCEKLNQEIHKIQQIMKLLLQKDDIYCDADDIGFTNLHIACITQDKSLIEKILNDKSNHKHYCIKRNSPVCPGYNALHFAAHYDIDVVKLLVKHGLNILAKDAKGTTPLDLCAQRYEPNDISEIIASHSGWNDITFSDGKTSLVEFLLAMKEQDVFEEFLKNTVKNSNIFIPLNSTMWPGCTPLHLAVFFERTKNLETLNADFEYDASSYDDEEEEGKANFYKVRVCLGQRADVTIQDAHQSTPLHAAFRLQKYEIVDLLLQFHHKTENPVDKGGLSHLHVACSHQNEKVVEKLVKNGDRINSPMMFSLCYRRIRYINSADDRLRIMNNCNHDAISLTDTVPLKRKLCVINLNVGSTPLHVAVAVGSCALMKKLFEHGANVYASDAYGLTAIHGILSMSERPCRHFQLPASIRSNCGVTDTGLSHLHVACFMQDVEAARDMLFHDADVEATVNYRSPRAAAPDNEKKYEYDSVDPYAFMSPYSGFRPLHFAARCGDPSIVQLLLENGADVLARSSNGSIPLFDILTRNDRCVVEVIVTHLRDDAALRKRIERETGLTMLHVLSRINDVAAIEELLSEGAAVDVNARVHEDSTVWPGYTPLHVLVASCSERGRDSCRDDGIAATVKLLIEHGADVAVANCDGQTPIHLAEMRSKACGILLRAVKSFSVNPVDRSGVSHFHIACLENVSEVVEEYLKNGVDLINTPIHHFHKWSSSPAKHVGGSSPLHLLMSTREFPRSNLDRTLNLLLEYGADINAEDCFGNSPLHIALAHSNYYGILNRIEKFINCGADMKAENIFGATIFEALMRSPVVEDDAMRFFFRNNYRLNSFNLLTEEGLLAIHFSIAEERNVRASEMNILCEECFSLLSDVIEADKKDRNAIHNIVSAGSHLRLSAKSYTRIIGKFLRFGYEIDYRDYRGRTPLHVAAEFRNERGILGLLRCGADMNALDPGGKTALAYLLEPSKNRRPIFSQSFARDLAAYLSKHQSLNLHAHELNVKAYRKLYQTYVIYTYMEELEEERMRKQFLKEIEDSKDRKINEVILYEFLSETNALAEYPYMSEEKRAAIAAYARGLNVKAYRKLFQTYATYADTEELEKEGTQFLKEMEEDSKDRKISELTLYDFLSETNALAEYPYMSEEKRAAIDAYFDFKVTTLYSDESYLKVFLLLQHNKAKARINLLQEAAEALNILSGYDVPFICSRIIFSLLSNHELSMLIFSSRVTG